MVENNSSVTHQKQSTSRNNEKCVRWLFEALDKMEKTGSLKTTERLTWEPLISLLQFYSNDPRRAIWLRRRLSIMLDMVAHEEKTNVLDVGCSMGLFVAEIAKKSANHAIGVDMYTRVFQLANLIASYEKVAEKTSFLIGDGQTLPIRNNSIDVVLCGEVIEHLRNPRKLLNESMRVLRPGGVIIISTPNGGNLFFTFIKKLGYHYKPHFREYTFSELTTLANTCKMRIEEIKFIRPTIPIGRLFAQKIPRSLIFYIDYIERIMQKISVASYFFSETIVLKCRKSFGK